MPKNTRRGTHKTRNRLETQTRRERPKSAPYLRLKNIQWTTIGNNWKIFLKKSIFGKKNFPKKVFFKKSRTMPKNSKRPFRLIQPFYKPKTSKKCKRVPFDRIRKFSKKSHSAKKTKGETLWSRLYFWKHKQICGLVQESNARSPVSQKISWTNEQKIVKKWTIQSEIVSWKRNKTGTSKVGAISKAQKAQNTFWKKNLKF